MSSAGDSGRETTLPSPCLLGHAAAYRLAGGPQVFIFGPGWQPRLRIEAGGGPIRVALTLAGDPIDVRWQTRTQGDVAFVELTVPPEIAGHGVLSVAGVSARTEWRVEWRADPEERALLAPARDLRVAGDCAAAWATLERLLTGPITAAQRFWIAFERGRVRRVEGRHDEASRIWEAAAAPAWAAGVDTWAARALRAATFLAYQTRDFERAISLLDRAREIEVDIADFEGQVNSAFYRGMVANERGAHVEARHHFERAVSLGRATGSDRVDFFETSLALRHLNLGEFAKARAIAVKVPDRLGSGLDDLHYQVGERLAAAWILTQCGVRLGTDDRALVERLLSEGLAMAREAGEPQLELAALFNQTWMVWWAGDLDDARRALETVRRRRDAFLTRHPGESMLMAREYELLSGRLHLAAGDLDTAEADFRRLLEQVAFESGGLPSLLVLGGWLGLARIARRRDDAEACNDALSRAMAVLTEMSLDVDRRCTVSLFRDRPLVCDPVDVIDARVDVSLAHGERQAAFAAADTLHALRRRAIDLRSTLSSLEPEARETWRRLGRKIDWLRTLYDETRADWSMAPERRSARLVALSAELRSVFDERLRLLESPRHTARERVTAAGVPDALTPDEALVLLRIRSRGTLEAWWVTRGHIECTRPTDLAVWLAPRLEGVEHLYVVGDRASGAWRLPEISVDGQPLAARVGLSHLGHAGALGRQPGPRVPDGPLVVLDPLDDLPVARQDAPYLTAHLADAHVLVGRQASRAALLDRLGRCDHFHFSGHGEIELDDGGVTLQLAGRETLRPEDVVGLGRVPRRVVLNGCRTAVGFAEQAVSLPGAFLTAGALSVLGTVRPVEDARASTFVRRFYAEGGAENPGAALRSASRQAAAEGDPVWSAYRLLGRR